MYAYVLKGTEKSFTLALLRNPFYMFQILKKPLQSQEKRSELYLCKSDSSSVWISSDQWQMICTRLLYVYYYTYAPMVLRLLFACYYLKADHASESFVLLHEMMYQEW
jgi:hypothetical protein